MSLTKSRTIALAEVTGVDTIWQIFDTCIKRLFVSALLFATQAKHSTCIVKYSSCADCCTQSLTPLKLAQRLS